MSIATTIKSTSQTQLTTAKPWVVIFHNDNETTFDCVIEILMFIIGKPQDEAYQTTLQIHKKGLAVVAQATQSIAEALKRDSEAYALSQKCPLKVTIERDI